MNKKLNHNEKIVEQFSKQAVPFTKIPAHLDGIAKLIKISGVKSSDKVLDIACGPGLVACAFAPFAKSVTGVDITDAMLAEASRRQRGAELKNMNWVKADVMHLPFEDGIFDIVMTRYSFHHLEEPCAVLSEMKRVCRTGGVIIAADMAFPEEKCEAFDSMEVLRDPSHVHALSVGEFRAFFERISLGNHEEDGYEVEIELEKQLAASFPDDENREIVRKLIKSDIDINHFGINAFSRDAEVFYRLPILIIKAQRI